jgi:hypothetical protein
MGWFAAPVIAVVCAVVVVRQAQLDIGFVRSQNEVAVVEMQADYPRALVTRYTSFYTSLSTSYDITFDGPGAQVLPFPAKGDPSATGLLRGESPSAVVYRYGADVGLDGFRVKTSSTQMIHCEQMLEMGGGWEWGATGQGGERLINRTGYRFDGVGAVRRTNRGEVETAWLGSLAPDEAIDLTGRWRPRLGGDSLWADRGELAEISAESDDLSPAALLALAEGVELRGGDVRLIGWTREPIAGMEVRPRAPQQRQIALLIR